MKNSSSIQLPETPGINVLFPTGKFDKKDYYGTDFRRTGQDLTKGKQRRQTYTGKPDPASILQECFHESEFYDPEEFTGTLNTLWGKSFSVVLRGEKRGRRC